MHLSNCRLLARACPVSGVIAIIKMFHGIVSDYIRETSILSFVEFDARVCACMNGITSFRRIFKTGLSSML